jgi:hypothetical protein
MLTNVTVPIKYGPFHFALHDRTIPDLPRSRCDCNSGIRSKQVTFDCIRKCRISSARCMPLEFLELTWLEDSLPKFEVGLTTAADARIERGLARAHKEESQ